MEFQNEKILCSLIRFNEDLDIALLKINNETFRNSEILGFANYDIKIGDQVFASGFPLITTMGKELKITAGIVSSLKGFSDDDRYFQTSAPIDPGNSGGPLIDKFGNIIGLITAKHSFGTNVGYSLKIEFLINEKYIKNATSERIVMPPQDIYNKAKKTLCIVKNFAL